MSYFGARFKSSDLDNKYQPSPSALLAVQQPHMRSEVCQLRLSDAVQERARQAQAFCRRN